MSELKATTVYDAYWKANSVGEGTGILVYLKSEADKVIAELKAQKAQAENDCAYWKTMSRKCADDNEVMAKQRAKAFKREHHHKYKRCLAMAKWCESENYTSCWYHENSERCEWTEKWHKRWLELAKKFKEAK